MSMKLMLVTSDHDNILEAQKAGIDRIFFDLEYINKTERQRGRNTLILHNDIEEIPHIRIGKRGNIRFRKSTLDRYLDKQEEKSEDNIEQDLTPNRREENIVELREKYNKTNKVKSIEEIMQTVKFKK